jgi:hypothetical protein
MNAAQKHLGRRSVPFRNAIAIPMQGIQRSS